MSSSPIAPAEAWRVMSTRPFSAWISDITPGSPPVARSSAFVLEHQQVVARPARPRAARASARRRAGRCRGSPRPARPRRGAGPAPPQRRRRTRRRRSASSRSAASANTALLSVAGAWSVAIWSSGNWWSVGAYEPGVELGRRVEDRGDAGLGDVGQHVGDGGETPRRRRRRPAVPRTRPTPGRRSGPPRPRWRPGTTRWPAAPLDIAAGQRRLEDQRLVLAPPSGRSRRGTPSTRTTPSPADRRRARPRCPSMTGRVLSLAVQRRRVSRRRSRAAPTPHW